MVSVLEDFTGNIFTWCVEQGVNPGFGKGVFVRESRGWKSPWGRPQQEVWGKYK